MLATAVSPAAISQIADDKVYAAYAHEVRVHASEALKDGTIQDCTYAGYKPGDICSGNRNKDGYGCFMTNATDDSISAKTDAANRLLSMYPKSLTWTFQSGATTEIPVAYTVPGCATQKTDPKSVFVCSHLSAAGDNGGIEYPFWVAQSWMYKRFIQYDLRQTADAPAGTFRFTDMGAADCVQFGK